MTRNVAALLCGVFVLLALTGQGRAHPLEYVEDQLTAKGSFFQPLDMAAPDFRLLDGGGNDVTLEIFSGKILVLYFASTACPGGCAAQTESLAEIQSMVNISAMRDYVRFVAIVTDSNPANSDPYATRLGVDPANWTTLFGHPDRPDAVRQLMAEFGLDSTSPETDPVAHIVGLEGRWHANFVGSNFPKLDMVVYLNALFNFATGVSDGH